VQRLAHTDADIRARTLGLPRRRAVVALFGTREALDTDLAASLLPVLREVVARAARRDAVFVTSAADVGVVHLLGLAVEALDGRWPGLVGVAPSGRVVEGEDTPVDGQVALNANHDVAVLVPGSAWGDEVPALFRTVDAIVGKRRPAVALLVGGSDTARRELIDHLGSDRKLVVLAGTGGLADEIAGGKLPIGGADNQTDDDDLAVLVRSGQVSVVHLDEGPEKVAIALGRYLGSKPGSRVQAAVPPLAVLPKLRFRAPDPVPIIDPGFVVEYPLLADAILEANRLIAPTFHECDAEARREQNRARLLIVSAIGAGFAATAFGALQAWLAATPWPGVLVALFGAAAAALVALSRRYEASEDDLDARSRAESLRALYFDHLAEPAPATDDERAERVRELETAVARYRHESVTP
jgi:hypothetical protein